MLKAERMTKVMLEAAKRVRRRHHVTAPKSLNKITCLVGGPPDKRKKKKKKKKKKKG